MKGWGRAAAGKPGSRFGWVSGQWEDGAVGTGMARERLRGWQEPRRGLQARAAILNCIAKTRVSVCGICEDVGREMRPVSARGTGKTGVYLPSHGRRRWC